MQAWNWAKWIDTVLYDVPEFKINVFPKVQF